ncbi:BlaI/MecI/CopY family transcriptional regulator [Streptomyces sp. NBC_01446]|uniref:BlaI/MecI/CopY family transcriptional regulator n=1 Tax=Streptomyces sp. NBC_00119 TaxID=2975659 RepID=A0AAU1UJ99_9ACTN|nr:BlaI/MecI/CopY family transcriptional regulator [Streptomyces sp. NBC_01446]MCX4647354.1 BlaI/MecI/CopY family transcriptional regulator [Streptomyces sp. NBC_01446]
MGAQEPVLGAGGRRRANGALEAEILGLLHSAERALTPGDVAERLMAPLAHTTLATTLARLKGRGILERTPLGRSYAYRPVTDESGLTARHMHQVTDAGTDRASVLTHFVDELSDDEDLLRRLLGSDG